MQGTDTEVFIFLPTAFIIASRCVGTPSERQQKLSMLVPEQSNRKATK